MSTDNKHLELEIELKNSNLDVLGLSEFSKTKGGEGMFSLKTFYVT